MKFATLATRRRSPGRRRCARRSSPRPRAAHRRVSTMIRRRRPPLDHEPSKLSRSGARADSAVSAGGMTDRPARSGILTIAPRGAPREERREPHLVLEMEEEMLARSRMSRRPGACARRAARTRSRGGSEDSCALRFARQPTMVSTALFGAVEPAQHQLAGIARSCSTRELNGVRSHDSSLSGLASPGVLRR